MKTIVYVAKDFAPTVALRAVSARVCENQDYISEEHLGGGGEMSSKGDILNSLNTGCVLVSGMGHSAEASELELYAINSAWALGLPIALYADTWGCALRKWFEPIREKVSLLFVVNESEREEVKQFFPNAQVIASGNPLWQTAAFPTKTREDVRKKYNIGENVLNVFLICRKEKHINLPHIQAVIDAVKENASKYPIKVLASVHPGSPDKEQYAKIFSQHSFIEEVAEKAQDILPGVDVVINAGSGAGIEAVYQRVPVIEFTVSSVLDEVERLHGKRVWQLVADGVAVVAHDSVEISKLLDTLREGGEILYTLHSHAEKKYPLPKSKDMAVMVMADEIQKMC